MLGGSLFDHKHKRVHSRMTGARSRRHTYASLMTSTFVSLATHERFGSDSKVATFKRRSEGMQAPCVASAESLLDRKPSDPVGPGTGSVFLRGGFARTFFVFSREEC